MDDAETFGRLISALRPWLDQVVIVGGWAHRLYRMHPQSHAPAHAAILTREADVALPGLSRLTGDLAAALQAAGFQEELLGDLTPPVTHYRFGTEDEAFYAEFLTPLYGRGTRADGRPDAAVAAAGITAQKLRHLNILFLSPWSVRVAHDVGVPVAPAAEVLIPNPVSYLAQKLLIFRDRPPRKRAQDTLYVHDTLQLFGDRLEHLKGLWRDEIRPRLGGRLASKVEGLCETQYGALTDVIRNAARIPQDRLLEPERLQAACALGLNEIFGH